MPPRSRNSRCWESCSRLTIVVRPLANQISDALGARLFGRWMVAEAVTDLQLPPVDETDSIVVSISTRNCFSPTR